MRTKQLLTKMLLVTLCLVGGTSAWADTETVTVLSENYESYSVGDIKSTMQSNGWTFAAKNTSYPYVTIIQGTGDNTSKYLNMVYADGGAERTQNWIMPSSALSALNADNWTLTFDAQIKPGTNTNYRFAISGNLSPNSFATTTSFSETGQFFYIINAESGSTSYSASVAGTAIGTSFTLTEGTWYKFMVRVTNINTYTNTATVYAKITSYDGQTTLVEGTQSDISTTSIGTLKGMNWYSPKKNDSKLVLDNVLLTKEVDASVVADPTYTITAVAGTSRKFTLACETVGSTIYYASSNLEKGADGWTEYTSEVTTPAETIYAYAQKNTTTSDIISFATGAGTEVILNAPSVSISAMTLNGEKYNATYSATSDQNEKTLSPTATLSATFNGSPVSLPYVVTATGTLTVTASATGYTSASTNVVITHSDYIIANSADFTGINNSNIEEKLGSSWTVSASVTRWASWSKTKGINADGTSNGGESYYTASTTDGFPVTIYNDFFKLKNNETQLLIGWGFGKNNGTVEFNLPGANTNGIAEYIESDYGGTDYSRFITGTTDLACTTYKSGVIRGVKYYAPYVTASIGANGYATFCSEYPLDFTNVEDATAWVATASDGTKVTMTQVTGDIYQGKGLVLKSKDGNAAEVNIPIANSSTNYYDDNKLVACPNGATVTPSSTGTNYVLSVQSGVVVFAPVSVENNWATVAAGHAYLYVSTTNGARTALNINFDDEVTGLGAMLMKSEERIMNNSVYNLNGQRIDGSRMNSGIYIHNGRKVVVK